jgi:hypothetical protein
MSTQRLALRGRKQKSFEKLAKLPKAAGYDLTNALTPLPPTAELFLVKDFAPRHPNLLNENRVRWAVRNRFENGLAEHGGVYESPCGHVLHEPSFLTWWLSRDGRNRPRATRCGKVK